MLEGLEDQGTEGTFSLPTTDDTTHKLNEKSLDALIRMRVACFVAKLEDHSHTGLYEKVIESVEKPLVEEVLRRVGGNQTKAGKILGINRNTLRKKLRLYGLHQ